MKTKLTVLIALFLGASIGLCAQTEGIELAAKTTDIVFNIVAWYGAACVAFNGLTALIGAVVARTPGHSDDEAIEKIYSNGIYKLVAWVFSWGDYIAELVTKLKK